ncbi:serine/threonine-protein kinase [Brevibacillus sp. AG]|uniref:serine/threonine protein kinase n=1 Tax=Brevibacillus sp. AG TaxID=3020891 RepID=UPI00232C117D|nr:serine/threonine-protein kinase [Brevibacillus sp. AG]MDC0764942.1 serine/threonine-protein kinase [Brevibacillus sp. AG]
MVGEFHSGNIIDGRYEVVEKKGGGGFGRVVSVKDLQTDQIIALKYCTETDPEHIRRFAREVRIMSNLDHENVINIMNSNLEHSPPYFTMPLALHSVTQLIPILENNIDQAIAVFESICKGISAVHSSGFTHRDIKPDNALVFEGGKIVVSDLGLAKFDERDSTVLTRASIYMGTYDYMPPEQMTYGGTRDLDHRGDIFQLGKTLYHLITGNRPTVLNSGAVSAGIWYVIQKATRQNPDERYRSIDQMLDALYDARRASDPAMNPKNVFTQLVNIAEEKLKENLYDPENASKIIQLVYSTEDDDDCIELFHKIPDRLLQVYAANMGAEFEPVLKRYTSAIDNMIGGYAFHHAETVAYRMNIVFRNAILPDLKRLAVISVLFAAVRLNRFSAMGDFDQMLRSIRDDSDAYAVADGLREEISDYMRLCDRIPKKELHPAIQTVWEQCHK